MPSSVMPDDPRGVGRFVNEHYAPKLRRAVYRRLLATGDTFTPAGTGGTPRTPPRGGRTATTTRTAALNRLQPREWTGSPGIIGGYAREPRLDPTRFEWVKNPENGRWFARPRTELTGLNDQQTADIKGYDTQTAGQSQRIQGAYDQAAKDAEGNASQTSAALAALVAARGSGYAAADPTGQVLGQAARDSSASATAPIVAGLGRLAPLTRSEGLTALERFSAERLGKRAETISGYRSDQQEAATALREQNLAYLDDLAGNKTDLAKANLASKDKAADRAARLAEADADRSAKLNIEAARLESAARIAEGRNQTSRANALTAAAAKKRKEARKASNSDIRQWAKRAREMWDGVPRKVTGPDGKPTTEYLQYDTAEIIRELIAMGAPRARAVAIARGVSNQPWAGRPISPETSAGIRSIF